MGKKYITVQYASGKEKLRLGWGTLTFDGREYKGTHDVSDSVAEARKMADKWRRKGYNARINKGPGVWGARYTYAVYVRKRR